MMKMRALAAFTLGVGAAILAAFGVVLVVMWAFDGADTRTSAPQLLAGLSAVVAAVCMRWASRVLHRPIQPDRVEGWWPAWWQL
jgi:branched-subunit amino acid transport protein